MGDRNHDTAGIRRGDAVLLTHDATVSVLRVELRTSPAAVPECLVGLVIDELEPMETERVWGVLVNGRFEQILETEIDQVLRDERE